MAWEYGCLDPGWCKLDWVVAEPDKGRVVNVSNMLDVTWEASDGTITPLDGFIDPYFQEVYLEADSVPLFSKLAQHISPRALEEYVQQLTGEVYKYTHKHVNYGKVAKRMYNIFRLTGRHQAAALIRELFDEPAALLYQVWALLDTLDEASQPGSTIDRQTLVRQTDELIRNVVSCCDGPMETEVVMALLRLRDDITGWEELAENRDKVIGDSRARVEAGSRPGPGRPAGPGSEAPTRSPPVHPATAQLSVPCGSERNDRWPSRRRAPRPGRTTAAPRRSSPRRQCPSPTPPPDKWVPRD